MHLLYLFSVWLHVMAAIVWVGGMLFLVLVVVPWLRSPAGRAGAGSLLRDTGVRFRTIGWLCFATVLATGTFNLWVRGVRWGDLVRPAWLASSFGEAVVLKLGFFTAVLAVSAVHDFVVGPRASEALAATPGSPRALRLRRQATVLGRSNALLALGLVALGVMIVRGTPW